MDQDQIRPKRASILKRQSTFDQPPNMDAKEEYQKQQQIVNEDHHVHIDQAIQVIPIQEEKCEDEPHKHTLNDIHVPKKVKNISEAELIKMSLKKPQIWDDEDA